MIYKFDILFKKPLSSGGLKVVTYTSLLQNPEVFGEGEGFADATGELSLVLEGTEEGYSINALYRKYRAQLVGLKNAELIGKEFSPRFVFSKPDNLYSIKMVCRNEDGKTCSIDTDSFALLVAKDSACTITDGVLEIKLQVGQVAFCTTPFGQLTIEPDSTHVIIVNDKY